MPTPQNLRAPQDNPNGRGRSMDTSRQTVEGSNEVTLGGSGSGSSTAPATSTVNHTTGPVVSQYEPLPSLAAQMIPAQQQTESSTSQSVTSDFAAQTGAGHFAEHAQTAPITVEAQTSASHPARPVQSEQASTAGTGSGGMQSPNVPFHTPANPNT
jgi:hypothetical protein